MMSRMLGLRLPVRGEWVPKIVGYQKRSGVVVLEPPRIRSARGRDIGISLVLLVSSREESLEEFISRMGQKGLRRIQDRPCEGGLARMYEWKDPATYADMGGAHGYAAFLTSAPSSENGLRIEIPIRIEDGDDEPSYFTFRETFDRLDHDLHYAVILDACGEVQPQARALYDEFLSGIVFE